MKTIYLKFKKRPTLLAAAFMLSLGSAFGQALTTLNFNYTGSPQMFTVPSICVNQLTVEVWGAEGGGSGLSGNTASGFGGKGGYSGGVLNVSPGTVLYIYVGGYGQSANTGPAPGGWNGGGDGYASSSGEPGNGGGGGSDIRVGGQGFSNRVIVAGGGGGGGEDAGDPYGDGGGLTGVGYASYDATQVSAGPGPGAGVGQGANTNLGDGGGGGGGYFGGGSIDGFGSIGNDTQGGGGGSGYIGGVTSGTIINGQNSMPNPAGGTMIGRLGNGFVRITYDATSPLVVTATPSISCPGKTTTLTAVSASHTWQATGSSAPSITVAPLTTTSYSVSGTGAGTLSCFGTAVITITVMPSPTLAAAVIPTVLCVGKTATLIASGANTYTWNAGPTGSLLTTSPGASSTYTLVGGTSFGCTSQLQVPVNVNTNSLSVVSATSMCEGSSVNLSASGAVTYTWTNSMGNNFSNFSPVPVSPSSTTNYTVSGTDAFGCVLKNQVAVTVNASPNLNASSTKQTACKWDNVTLTATGATSYSWTGPLGDAGTGASITVNLPINVLYTFTVVGVDNTTGCTSTEYVSVNVEGCVGINEASANSLNALVYPNPTNNELNIELNNGKEKSVQVIDLSGRVVLNGAANEDRLQLDLSPLANGIYYVKIQSGEGLEVVKIVKDNR